MMAQFIYSTSKLTIKPVSYTHLDVYKRQAQKRQLSPVSKVREVIYVNIIIAEEKKEYMFWLLQMFYFLILVLYYLINYLVLLMSAK